MAGAKILDGQFSAVQQAIGTSQKNKNAAAFLIDFVAEMKATGFAAGLIKKHSVQGLSVAP
jgi:polar amino acid transport system substrate-binding protein